jgi:hypothetical protein
MWTNAPIRLMYLDHSYFIASGHEAELSPMPYASRAFLTLEDAQVGYASLSAVKLIRLNGYQASEGRDLRLRLPSFLGNSLSHDCTRGTRWGFWLVS